ncbi:hypothetical protein O181_054705 [Austropuccinia psidii MF-1]|uniref:Uncharacterized protein n=1 Tax=Austropuccinia psidii MF-1 TaxID=1389203 RepID=A0A9Q3HUL2_9BASI|nr:hypothetical protein [Austropuccinia psidii MF-1]
MPCRSVEKLYELLPDCDKISRPSQHLKVTQWVASIDGKEIHDAFNSRMEEKQPPTTQQSSKNSPNSQKQKFQHEKSSQRLRKKGKGKAPDTQTYSQGYRIPHIQRDAMENVARTMIELQKKEEARLKYQK